MRTQIPAIPAQNPNSGSSKTPPSKKKPTKDLNATLKKKTSHKIQKKESLDAK